MLVQIFDTSNFLYAQLKDGAHVSGINTTGLETLLTRLTRYKYNTNIFVLDPVAGEGVGQSKSGYKANRDGKPLEISIMEQFLEKFQKELGVTVIRTPSNIDKEADDIIYSLVHHYIYNTREDVIVYSDDRDLAGCIIDARVEKHPASSTVPKVNMKNYPTSIVRDAFVPYNLIAGYTMAMGKESDNIPADPDGPTLLHALDTAVRDIKRDNPYLYDNASSYQSMSQILPLAIKDDPGRLIDLMMKANDACLHLVPLDMSLIPNTTLETRINERNVFTALKVIGSRLRNSSRDINEELKKEMEAFFEQFATITMSKISPIEIVELTDEMIPEVDLVALSMSHKFSKEE